VTEPQISVVIPTHNRSGPLQTALAGLRGQTLPRERFEVIVVDDASSDDTPRVLAAAREAGEVDLVLRRDTSGGPGAARNTGWREARGQLIAFVDDDCRPTPEWLERGLEAHRQHPGAFIQGPVLKDPEHMHRLNPFAHFFEVHGLDQGFATANIFYSRALLDRLDGFDAQAFPYAGEDTDLGWRAIEAGAQPVFATGALVYHGIFPRSPLARLRMTARWTDTVKTYRRHPQIKKVKGVFWRHNHWVLFRFLVALALPRRLGPVRLWLAAPYVHYLTDRRSGPLLAPYLIALDLAEVVAITRGAVRYRVLVV
jgi:glycosyltransferase involved in cell wall biosynthesis